MRVIVSKILPYPETYPASDLVTREKVSIPSGADIHILKVEEVLLVSEMVYKELFEKAKNNNNFTP